MMIKRLDKEAYDRARRGYVAPTTLAPPGLEAHGSAHPMLARLKQQLMAKLEQGQALVQEKVTTPIKEKIKDRVTKKAAPATKAPE